MLIFSTMLNIRDTMSPETFIQEVLRWNQDSIFEENHVKNCNWNGERNIRFGNDTLWLDIEEYAEKNIIAVRYEKLEADGVQWDTDYIINLDEMKMSIQLHKSLLEDTHLFFNNFSSPYFIKQLIDNQYIVPDGRLDILSVPLRITENNATLITDVINGHTSYNLPVVYISKDVVDSDPVPAAELAYKLKGIAHVLLQHTRDSNNFIRELSCNNNEYNGAIGIYYPNGKHKRLLPHVAESQRLMRSVENLVIRYVLQQNIDELYTWYGVNNAILNSNLRKKQKEIAVAKELYKESSLELVEKDHELNKFIDAFDDDIEQLNKKIQFLEKQNLALKAENDGLRSKINSLDTIPLLKYGKETDLFPGEIKEFILLYLDEALKNTTRDSRRQHILQDVLDSNNYENIISEKREQIKDIITKGFNMKEHGEKLKDMGFEISDDGKHYRLTYCNDNRYHTTISKTSSDHREPLNARANILRDML